MKENIRVIRSADRDEPVVIMAKLKSTGKYAQFGTCHPATIPLIKRDGIKAHMHLVRVSILLPI